MEFIDELRKLKEQVKFSARFELDKDYDNIVIAGMGGSGIAGKIFQEIYTKKPVTVIDDYHIPEFVNEKTVFIGMSYSGNTEETISATNEAIKKGAMILLVTTGGKLSKMEGQKIAIPAGLQPRSSLGYMLLPLINTFMPQGDDVRERTYKALEKMDSDNRNMKEMAELIHDGDKIPVIYGCSPYRPVAYRWKTQLNENSKVLAYSSYFPELNHNDTAPLRDTYRKQEFIFFTFYTQSEPRVTKRIDVTSDLTDTKFIRIKPEGESLFEKLFYLIHYGDYLSYHLAIERKLDPSDVSIIEKLKHRLEQN